ncbi:hypothetical protein D3C81_1036460 [compost metagenome]
MRADLVPGFCLKPAGISSRQKATRLAPFESPSEITTSLSGSLPKPIRVGVVPEPPERVSAPMLAACSGLMVLYSVCQPPSVSS